MSTLSNATMEELEDILNPLGLSLQRGQHLKNLAEVILQSHGGKISCNREKLLELPGVGEYTAGAVLSFAYRKPEAIVDTNIARVLVRFYNIKPSRYEARRSLELWEKARRLIGHRSKVSHKVNWALLDLAAMICIPNRPNYKVCPLEEDCVHANTDGVGK